MKELKEINLFVADTLNENGDLIIEIEDYRFYLSEKDTRRLRTQLNRVLGVAQ